jgi:hypothetical protein
LTLIPESSNGIAKESKSEFNSIVLETRPKSPVIITLPVTVPPELLNLPFAAVNAPLAYTAAELDAMKAALEYIAAELDTPKELLAYIAAELDTTNEELE